MSQHFDCVAIVVLVECLLWVTPDVAVGREAELVARRHPFEPDGAVLGCGDIRPSHRRRLLDDCGCIEEVAEGLLHCQLREERESVSGDEVDVVLLCMC